MPPLPPVPNFRVAVSEPGHIRLSWADYPVELKAGRALLGFRIYRSGVRDELGVRIADEAALGPGVFQFDDTSSEAGPDRRYICVAVERAGYGQAPFGQSDFGEPDRTGFSLLPYNTRPFGSPLRGWGEAPFGQQPFGS